MTAAWIVYGFVIGTLLALTARGVAEMCRLSDRPSRWVWATALFLTAALTGVAPYRAAWLSPTAPTSPIGVAKAASFRPNAADAASPSGVGTQLPEAVHGMMPAPLQAAVTSVSFAPIALSRRLAVLWLALSTLVLFLLAAVYVRFNRMRHSWPVADLHGVRVRIAPDVGPVVIGLFRPEIIVPYWLLSRAPDEQRMVLAHECEHIRVRDPLVLTVAWLIAALLPWHPASWWMLSRLRLAMELDCDRRVLRQGVTPHVYGTLLLDLAGWSSGIPMIGAVTLTDTFSHLQKRLVAMKPGDPRFPRARKSILGTFVVAAIALVVGLAVTLPVRTPAQTPVRTSGKSSLIDFIGVWKAQADGSDIGLTVYPDSTLTITSRPTPAVPSGPAATSSMHREIFRVVSVTDDVLTVKEGVSKKSTAETRALDFVVNDRKLVLRSDRDTYFFTRQTDVVSLEHIPTLTDLAGTWVTHDNGEDVSLTMRTSGTFTFMSDTAVTETGEVRLAGNTLSLETQNNTETFVVALNDRQLTLNKGDKAYVFQRRP